jgi:hypothetical protein
VPVDFEIAQLPSPILEFGGAGYFTDQKTGLTEAGPFDLRFGAAHRSQVRIGLVGPAEMIEKAQRWYERCQSTITSGSENLVQYPPYYGFKSLFRADLVLSSRWLVEFSGTKQDLEKALALDAKPRFEKVLSLYSRGVEKLAGRQNKPDVVVCCLPDQVIRNCWSVTQTLTPAQKRAIKREGERVEAGQMSFFEGWEPEEDPGDLLTRDFRRALKARAMQHRMPIQIASDNVFVDSESNQDPATRAWNMSVALYYKAGGIPWRLRLEGPQTCFVGVSFHHMKTTRRHFVHSSIAQAFSSDGDGFALRGELVPWSPEQGRRLHLSEAQASKLGERILHEYYELNGTEPRRIVLHKTSKFDQAEIDGFKAAFSRVPIVELINLMPTMFRLVQYGAYPPARGTLCTLNGAAFVFTTGFVPEWGTYPGPHIPSPIRIMSPDDVDLQRAANEILGLTRINWNTAQNTSGQPVTLRFARRIGGIMAEVGKGAPEPSYRYYM